MENEINRLITFNDYLRDKYNCKVYRIPLNTGLTCPNRLNGSKGCIYCDDYGSGAQMYPENIKTIEQQIKFGIALFSKIRKAQKFYVYFQSFTNTYGEINDLKKLYDSALIDSRICGIIIGTRPDCIDSEKLKLISEYSAKYDVWIELGLQSSNNQTLNFLNRGHTLEDYMNAAALCREFNLKFAAHIIVGLPYETRADILNTATAVLESRAAGIKIHSLYIIKNTRLAELYESEKFKLLTADEYVDIVCEIIRILPDNMVYHRLTGETDNEKIIAPEWVKNKTEILNKIRKKL